MTGMRTAEYRTWALRTVTALVVLSFAFIPVRCDASTAPHSIFFDPVALASGHVGHDAAATATSHQHHAGMQHDTASTAPDTRTDSLADANALTLAAGTDTSSQQPVGAALDLPATPVPPAMLALLPQPGDPVMRVSAPATVLTGVATPPEAPPPKSA